MAERTLAGCRILVVEDEYMLAEELSYELEQAGAVVVGPAASVARALALSGAETSLDGAILDINLGGARIDPVADALASRAVPFVFVTGYDRSGLPERFGHVVCCEKPVSMAAVTHAIGRVIHV